MFEKLITIFCDHSKFKKNTRLYKLINSFMHKQTSLLIQKQVILNKSSQMQILIVRQIQIKQIIYMNSTQRINMDEEDKNQMLEDEAMEEIYISKIRATIAKSQEIINDQSGAQHILLFWGFSGTGKSTAANLLNGQEVLGYHHGGPILVQKYPSKEPRGVRIQISNKGGTVLQLKRLDKTKQRVMLWDIPGLGQNRGITQSMINSYFIHRIFSFHKHIKLFLTIDYIYIEPDIEADYFRHLIRDLPLLLGLFEKYAQGVALMITKVPTHTKLDDIIQIFQQISKLPDMKNRKRFSQFLQFVINRTIPIILVKRPVFQTQGKVLKQNAQVVTDQYKNFIEQTYDIVVNRLKSLPFPTVKSTVMSEKQIAKCRPIFESTLQLIQNQIKQITQNLKKFIIIPYSKVYFSSDVRKVQQLLLQCKKMAIFVNQIIKITQRQKEKNSREQLKNRFDKLRQLFQQADYLVQTKNNGKKICTHMVSFHDQYIMTKFLNTIQLKDVKIDFKWSDQSQLITQLFHKIQQLKIEQYWKNQQNSVHQNFREFVDQYFHKQFVGQIENEILFRSWADKFKMFYSFINITTEHCQQKESIPYFNQLKNKSNLCQIKASAKLDCLISILQINKKQLSKELDEQFINK